MSDDLTDDAFLGGQLQLLQPRSGYRAGIDPVLLAAAVPARAGQSVLDLGCGIGTAALCLGRRVSGLTLVGLDVQADYADLARQNASRNGVALDVVIGNATAPPAELRQQTFDHVITNPPFYDRAARTAAADAAREGGLSGADLTAWLDQAIRRLGPRGTLTMIHDALALPSVLAALDARVGGITVRPVAPRDGRGATRVLVTAGKGSRAPFTLAPPIILHAGDAHGEDRPDYTPEIEQILRHGAAFRWVNQS
ncbi:MAG: methyltransferase [Pseudomonadota bacterium]